VIWGAHGGARITTLDLTASPQLTELERTIAAARAALEDLNQRVGDPEVVADERGWLPSERRELALDIFAARRATEVCELRERIASQETVLKTTKGRPERARIREDLRKDSHRLSLLQAIPPMAAADMCSECVSPAAWHDPPRSSVRQVRHTARARPGRCCSRDYRRCAMP
jgi:hypothetical protein